MTNKVDNDSKHEMPMENSMVVTIIVRCIMHKAVNPPCFILCLGHDEWRTFLFASPEERKRMALTKLGKGYLLGPTRELVWIPYDWQNVIKIVGEDIDN